ncbi:type II toxin-antitoxin system PemK/MazF family toxin [Actinomyces procaprae]|uniref:type II toxin-antitoxin system PemK/MazF family toxin n=1 Tax=Actinomyces procaprae TaxID=2560010 RepID=UPI001FF8DBFF|nr:type II toxin-antitoxin system PemK/MazF family toxin [Actinomyces procaprae]
MGVGRVELTPQPLTGELWWAAPDPVVGREQSGRRPVLVLSGARYHHAVTTLAVTAR